MPNFHQEALEETRKMLLDRITRGPSSLEANDLCIAHNYLGVAERHARLLQAVWEAVKDDIEWDEAKHGPIHANAASGSIAGINGCKAHVRALLAQTEEQER